MSWTDERVSLLKKLWGEGKTAAEIASELGNVTRNAVIGKAHRLKLSNRVSPIQQNNKKPASRPPQAAASPEKKIQKIMEQDNAREGIDMMKLGPRSCRWPLGDPRDDRFGFCGDRIVEGLPYCDDHARVAYQAAGKARTLQAEDFEEKVKDTGTDDDAHGIKVANR
ncbi:MAG: gcrA cell cycle regulator family protein [Alphaproteobacteria bacterium]|nr:gcrA cell cycle regulator family protein [Alphaproteobacteria bacterium]